MRGTVCGVMTVPFGMWLPVPPTVDALGVGSNLEQDLNLSRLLRLLATRLSTDYTAYNTPFIR